LIRLNKYLAIRGLCSRREADRLIESGKVLVDGRVAPPKGMMVEEGVDIRISESGQLDLDAKITVMLNKPRGIVSHHPEEGQEEARSLLRPDRYRGELQGKALEELCQAAQSASVAGRLDRSSRGIIVFSNDGVVAKCLTSGGLHAKKYMVMPKSQASEEQIVELNALRQILHWRIRPMEVYRAPKDRLIFVLMEGKKHQIREACYHVGLEVSDLCRVQMGPLELGALQEGCWREITPLERERVLDPS